ncbi:MAG: SdrD B-like domain-containing protein, partial [Actinomycetota bacterium]|nr:SdrD B-like domain-containing protein [Actinomycetota bacterium]
LAVGAVATCEAFGVAELIQYANLGTVTGHYGEVIVTDTDPSHYAGQAVLGTAQLGDTVWYDTNNNGVQDSGEPGINGAVVTLKDASGTVVATLTTATGPWDGFYKFLELDAGTYTATLDMSSVKSTYELTTPGAFTITLADGDDYLDADFGLYEEEELPKTGFETEELALLAIGLLMLGTLAVLAANRWGFAEE